MFSNLFSAADISASGMSAERLRMETVANNIANANTTRSVDGLPYRRKQLVFSEILDPQSSNTSGLQGVRILGMEADQTPFETVHNPGHKDADENGMVKMPNVQIPNEMVDLITASRSYEANLKALSSFKDMVEQTLTLLRVPR
ncbi:flagellar basal body rod protein FlgC [bacterium]|jgi:flagellar basal-body rod protein FlgC|nr:flagellar basal body rod protein FlgC [bacterium]MDA7906728.1 flagellar basal body rod protein FlgC [Mariniblastus sp.]MDA7910308.1 flagellar basal body rod protein FlgC [bacterium]MDB4473208.1 flagellar basal body rod protein FlgC [bacterium]